MVLKPPLGSVLDRLVGWILECIRWSSSPPDSPPNPKPASSHEGSPEIVPRPNIVQPRIPPEMSEITLLPPSTASFSRRSSPSSSPAHHGQGSRRASPSYRSHIAFATSASSYPASQSPSPPMESSNIFGQMPSQRRTEEGILPSEPSSPSCQLQDAFIMQMVALRRVHPGRPCGPSSALLSGQRCCDQVLYTAIEPMCVCLWQKSTQQAYTSQVLQPEEVLYLRKKKKRPILHDPYTRFSALLYRRPPREDQKSILASMDYIDLDHATLL
ncbi:hypothetical protein F7725_007259 [Dissostichus mawsoni]|uniref:Uncharacterized protein n=1 Tax=Dissostichus mawsoni TaxID=36200 RepID=A0A7J5XY09_DISMA|nr:hypothetical protein F7725_007259 [Dissostichus mawsoni]